MVPQESSSAVAEITTTGDDASTMTTATTNSINDLYFLEMDPVLVDAEIVDLTLFPHRPLGCTIEESLPSGTYLFVSHVTAGSRGERGGLRLGDVILACTGLFGTEMTSAARGGQQLETLIGLVKARPKHESLELRVARGTSVLEQHEQALVELCSKPGASSTTIENCLLDFLKQSYEMPVIDNFEFQNCESEENCLLDVAFDLWNQDFEITPLQKPSNNQNNKPSQQPLSSPKVKPWSSQSSPSGTFIQDPVMGQMRNMDA